MQALPKPLALLILAGLSVLAASCVDQISADLPEPPKVLVVNSIMNPDSVFRVQVSRVTSTVDSSSRLFSTASVYLQTPGRSDEQLRNQGRGLYVSPNKPAEGGAYTLRAEADGYPAALATDTVPAAVPIRETWYSYPTGTDRNNELLGTIVVRFDDPADEVNYYEISAYQQQYGGQGRVFRSQDFVLDARGNAALVAEGDAEFSPGSLVFSDKLFNGQAFELRASFKPWSFAGSERILGEAFVSLRSISRSYYQYRKSWARHFYNQGTKGPGGDLNQLLFLGDPSRMYSNVNGGYGVVVGHAQTVRFLHKR
ncbi:DUF4249 domain-containing protein [Hymenobacter sp. IS2118]|uniref:DUF4249 domain-containing protein n=1 Tax=Hymenobacter sp. IS2118 TaxID=1505605 RepID=UPI000551050E|nr:DUF4249 domain-containing protein [Hymenobacter sp. IS2118]